MENPVESHLQLAGEILRREKQNESGQREPDEQKSFGDSNLHPCYNPDFITG
jgi:hypothetical protein